jgi:uncharacterized protein YuzE
MENRIKIGQIRGMYLKGSITLEKAEELVGDLLVDINKKGEAVAKEYGKKYKKLTFNYVFR